MQKCKSDNKFIALDKSNIIINDQYLKYQLKEKEET